MTIEVVDTAGGKEYAFSIDAYTPDTLPMARLAEYMTDLSKLLGETGNVHFVRLDEGSAKLIHKIDAPAIYKVRQRVIDAQNGNGPLEAIQAIRVINKRLREDNGTAVLVEGRSAEIIRFPGREEVAEEVFVSMTEEGSLDGIVVRVGGLKEWVPVHLEEGEGRVQTLLAKRPLAKELAAHLWSSRIRVTGFATWLRGFGGVWQLEKFYAHGFKLLSDTSLSEVVEDLRQVEGNDWPLQADGWGELRRIRYGSGDQP